jgi:protein involved in polysaccharide export with SLBB domain
MNRLFSMFRTIITGTVFAAIVLVTSAYGQQTTSQEPYRLGPGDWIVIDVFGEEDLSMDVMLNDTGVIDYPFLGTLEVEGLTVVQLESVLLGGLKGPYLVDPDITVAVKQYRNIYVNGEVENPGAFPYEPGMTVEKAIAMAGGFTERASRKKIEANRAADSSGQSQRISGIEAVRPGDIITVPQSFF